MSSDVTVVQRVSIPLNEFTTLEEVQSFVSAALTIFGTNNPKVGAEQRGSEVQLYATADVA